MAGRKKVQAEQVTETISDAGVTATTAVEHLTANLDSKYPVDWRSLLDNNLEKYVVLHKENAVKRGIIKSKIISRAEELEVLKACDDDNCKLVLLRFFQDLAIFGNASQIEYTPIGNCNEDWAGLICKITWNNQLITSGVADAHRFNCFDFAKNYCAAIAENRSFVRAVKRYFNIPLLGKDEVGPNTQEEENGDTQNHGMDPHSFLENIMNKYNISFDSLKKTATKSFKDADTWEKITDISSLDALSIAKKIQDKHENVS